MEIRKTKVIIELIIIFVVVLIAGLAIHKVFLNLEYEVLRSSIVAIGVTLWRYLSIRKQTAE